MRELARALCGLVHAVSGGLPGKAWQAALHLPFASCNSQRAGESDVESGKGLHQGDLRVGIRFTPAAVPMAAPALQGFVTVPLLLSLLLLQSLLLPPLFVGDLKEKPGELPAWGPRAERRHAADGQKGAHAASQ